jgi:hypothetical protein
MLDLSQEMRFGWPAGVQPACRVRPPVPYHTSRRDSGRQTLPRDTWHRTCKLSDGSVGSGTIPLARTGIRADESERERHAAIGERSVRAGRQASARSRADLRPRSVRPGADGRRRSSSSSMTTRTTWRSSPPVSEFRGYNVATAERGEEAIRIVHEATRPHAPRHHDAGHGRVRGGAPDPRHRGPGLHPHHLRHRPGLHRGQGDRARCRRRRLPDQAHQLPRARGPGPLHAPDQAAPGPAGGEEPGAGGAQHQRRAHRPLQPPPHPRAAPGGVRPLARTGEPVSVVMLDLDKFKAVNDTTATRPATGSSRSWPTSSGKPPGRSTASAATAARSSSPSSPRPIPDAAVTFAERVREMVEQQKFEIGEEEPLA